MWLQVNEPVSMRLTAAIQQLSVSWGRLALISDVGIITGGVCRQEDDGQRLLKVNFDPELVRALREVHYFLLMPELPQAVPAPALKVPHPPCPAPNASSTFTQQDANLAARRAHLEV